MRHLFPVPNVTGPSLAFQSLVARVQPEERRDALGVFLAWLGFAAAYGLLEVGRDALFLASSPASRLPWAYLTIVLVSFVGMRWERRITGRASPRGALVRWLLVTSGVTAGLGLMTAEGGPWIAFVLYAWSGVVASLALLGLWTLVGGTFKPSDLGRLAPVFLAGGLAGGALGAGAAWLLAQALDARHLVLASSAVFLLAAAAPAGMSRPGVARPGVARPAESGGWASAAPDRTASAYLRRVGAVLVAASVTLTLVDFAFMAVVDQHVPAEGLASFLAAAHLSFAVLAAAVQIGLVGLVLRVTGVAGAIVLVPAILLAGTLGFAVVGGLAAAVALRGIDGALRPSLLRTGQDLLVASIPARVPWRLRGVADLAVRRSGQGLAAVLILMVLSTTESLVAFAAVAALAAAGWIALAMALRGPYLEAVRRSARLDEAQAGRAFPELDLASRDALVATLSSADDRAVIAALEILEQRGEMEAVPAPLLYHPSPPVAVRAIDSLAKGQRHDALPIVRRLLDDSRPDIRAASVRALVVLDPERAVFERMLDDADPRVWATAGAALTACGWGEAREIPLRLLDLVTRGDAAVQRAVAAALRARPSPLLEEVLLELLQARDAAVLEEAAAAAVELRTPAVIEPLIALLARRAVRGAVHAALAALGPLALERLIVALEAGSVAPEVRRHVPGAIAATGSPRAPHILLRHLEHESDGLVRFEVLAALGRWRRHQPTYPLDARLLHGAFGYAVTSALRLMGWRRVLTRAAELNPSLGTELHDILVALLRDRQRSTVERIFRLLDLESGGETFMHIHRALRHPRAASRAAGRRRLEGLLVGPLRKPLLTLLDDVGDGSLGAEPALEAAEDERTHYARVLTEIVLSGMESASSLAAAHAAELHLVSIRATLETVQPLSTEHRRTLVSAARRLAEGGSQ